MGETARWYVVHTYSGYENTVKATIEKTVESRQLQDQILAISIPLDKLLFFMTNPKKYRKIMKKVVDIPPPL